MGNLRFPLDKTYHGCSQNINVPRISQNILELHWHPPDLLRFATLQYHGLVSEAQLLHGLEEVFRLLNTLLQEARCTLIFPAIH